MKTSNSFSSNDTKIKATEDSNVTVTDMTSGFNPQRTPVTAIKRDKITQREKTCGDVKFKNMYSYTGKEVKSVNSIYCNNMAELMIVSKSWYNKKYHVLEVETINQLKEFENHPLEFTVNKNDGASFSFYNVDKIYGRGTKVIPMILEKNDAEILRVLVVANKDSSEKGERVGSINWGTIMNYLKDYIKENNLN